MADLRQQLVGARRALLILGWALVIAKVALALEANVRARLNAPATLAERICPALDDDAIAGNVNAATHDARGRAGYAENQLIVRFRDGVTGQRCREILHTQGTRSARLLDSYRSIYLAELSQPERVPDAIDQFTVLAEVDYTVPNVFIYAD